MTKEWFQKLKDRRQVKRRRKEQKRIVKALDAYMDKNAKTPSIYDNSDARFGMIAKVWLLGNDYVLSRARYIRGDVIELKRDGRLLAGWADQSFQYDGLMGKNDFYFDPTLTLKDVEELLNQN